MGKLVNPLAEQEDIQTVKENIDNGNITSEQAEKFHKTNKTNSYRALSQLSRILKAKQKATTKLNSMK